MRGTMGVPRPVLPAAAAIALTAAGFGIALTATRVASQATGPMERRSVSLTVTLPPGALPPATRTARLWVPIPPSTKFQVLHGFTLSRPLPFRIVEDREYGNRFLLLETGPGSTASGRGLSLTFRVTRVAFPSGMAEDSDTPRRLLERFLRPDRLVPDDGRIAAEAREAGGTDGPALTRARRLFDHIVATVRYNKEGTGWGRGDATWVCESRRGNCSDFHSLFIGEARALGIPARFVIGVPLPVGRTRGDIPGYHCWAEFFVAGAGWVPVDASEASQDPARRDALFAGLDADRVQFTIGRDITVPDATGQPVNFAINALAEVDGQAVRPVETRFSFQEANPS